MIEKNKYPKKKKKIMKNIYYYIIKKMKFHKKLKK